MAKKENRRLAAIMFSDIAGYSAMMQRDEQDGREKAIRYREETLENLVHKHGGEIWQHYGDGSLSIFPSAVESLRCAKALQLTLQQEPKIPLRLGIHVGDIVKHGNDIYGDGINIASRVESLGVPGSVLLTERLVFDIKNHPEFEVTLLGKFAFKNIERPMEVFALVEEGLIVPDPKLLQGKAKLLSEKRGFSARSLKLRPFHYGLGLAFLLFLIFAYQGIKQHQQKQWALKTAIPEIKEHLETLTYGWRESTNIGSGPAAWDALDLAKKTQSILPNHQELQHLWGNFTQKINLSSFPHGAKVYARPCTRVDSSWRFIGHTPLDSVLLPNASISIRIEKEEYEPIDDLISLPSGQFNWHYVLDEAGSIPEKMILVRPHGNNSPLDSFLVDKYEVSNRDFSKFVKAGGYKNPGYWKHPFIFKGKTLRWEEATQLMIDETGRPSPSNWVAGDFPEGKGDHPVSGISWYEAAAYAEFVGKLLPSRDHFRSLIALNAMKEVRPMSNYNKKGTTEVGSSKVQNKWGVYDLFGNVGEWCYNDFGESKKLILGGAWNDEAYVCSFRDNARDPFDRSSSNGFRCIQLFDSIEKYVKQYDRIIPSYNRNYYEEQPVDDKVFEVYLNQFVYDKIDLAPKILYRKESEDWVREKVEISIPYEEEKLTLYLFLPKNGKAPFQTIIFRPHIGTRRWNSSEESLLIKTNDFLVKNGRAVVYPIFKGTYERKFSAQRQCNDWRVCDKEQKILTIKDLKISIDYLETRQDINTQKIAYAGMSWGGILGGFALAIEPRLKLGILKSAAFVNNTPFPEVDPFHYHPRVKVPVLMLTGILDPYFPYHKSQKPFFNSLGTAPKDKKWVIYEDGHSVPRTESIKEILDFLDQYFGPVENLRYPIPS